MFAEGTPSPSTPRTPPSSCSCSSRVRRSGRQRYRSTRSTRADELVYVLARADIRVCFATERHRDQTLWATLMSVARRLDRLELCVALSPVDGDALQLGAVARVRRRRRPTRSLRPHATRRCPATPVRSSSRRAPPVARRRSHCQARRWRTVVAAPPTGRSSRTAVGTCMRCPSFTWAAASPRWRPPSPAGAPRSSCRRFSPAALCTALEQRARHRRPGRADDADLDR